MTYVDFGFSTKVVSHVAIIRSNACPKLTLSFFSFLFISFFVCACACACVRVCVLYWPSSLIERLAG